MTFREIDERLASLVDPETGEILDIDDFELLQMERDKKAENMALWVLDLQDEVNALTDEINRLKDKKTSAEKKIASLKHYLPVITRGEKLKTPLISVSYRNCESVEVLNKEEVIDWAQKHDRDDILKYSEPEISKSAVKKLIADGQTVPGVAIAKSIATIIK